HRATTGRPADDGTREMRNRARVVPLARGLVASERDAGRVEAIQAQERPTGAVGLLEQRLVRRHILRARATLPLDQHPPPNGSGALGYAATAAEPGAAAGRSSVAGRPTAVSPREGSRAAPAAPRTPGSGPR